MHRRADKRRAMTRLLLCLGICLVAASSLQAQERERLRQQVEMTDGILERAHVVVEEHPHPRAQQQLRFAYELQEMARHVSQSPGSNTMEIRRGAEATLRARALAERAVQIASQQARLQQRALNALELLERRLEDARLQAGDRPNSRSLRTMEFGERRLEQAREAFREQRFQEVLRMCIEARRLLDGFVRPPASRHVERMLENTSRLLETARDDVPDDPRAQEILHRASQLLEQAEAAWLAGRVDESERLVRQAREQVLQAMRRGTTPPDAAHVDLVLDETTLFVDEVAQQVHDSESSEAATLIENARGHLERARTLRLESKLERALEEARVARNLAYRASRLVGPRE